jgi:hypothetical protein
VPLDAVVYQKKVLVAGNIAASELKLVIQLLKLVKMLGSVIDKVFQKLGDRTL